MRKVTFGRACSLDMFIAREDHSVDWLMWCDEAAEVMNQYWRTIDTIIMGRLTYEVALANGSGSNEADIATWVCSRTLIGDLPNGVKLAHDAVGLVSRLKQEEGRDICIMGGGNLAQSLLEAGLIDEIGLNVHPVLLGSGIPLFLPMERQVNLELVESRPFSNGCVLATYRVNNS